MNLWAVGLGLTVGLVWGAFGGAVLAIAVERLILHLLNLHVCPGHHDPEHLKEKKR